LELNKDNFYTDKNATDGYCSWCKTCKLNYQNSYQNKHKEEQKVRRKKCRDSNLDKELDYNKNWREDNRDHIHSYTKDYQQSNPERLRGYNETRKHKNHTISKKAWKYCLGYFNYKCVYCGISLEDHKKKYNQQLHKEHVIHDGNNDLSNCVPSCKDCNSHKWKYDMETWYKQQDYYTENKYNKIAQWLKEDYKNFIV